MEKDAVNFEETSQTLRCNGDCAIGAELRATLGDLGREAST
jgi:hypothetical protein